MSDEARNGALSSILTALESIRNEVRELQKEDAKHMAALAVLNSQMIRVEAQVQNLFKTTGDEKVKNATQTGKNEAKWAMIGSIGTAVLGGIIYFISQGL